MSGGHREVMLRQLEGTAAEVLARHGGNPPPWLAAEVVRRLSYTYLDEERYPCGDNLRVALAGNAGQVAEYMEAVGRGCCGSVDEVWLLWDTVGDMPGQVPVMVGWNYGH